MPSRLRLALLLWAGARAAAAGPPACVVAVTVTSHYRDFFDNFARRLRRLAPDAGVYAVAEDAVVARGAVGCFLGGRRDPCTRFCFSSARAEERDLRISPR